MAEEKKAEAHSADSTPVTSVPSPPRVSYILVGEEGNESDAIELPVELNGLMPISTLQAQYPGATCLKFKHVETGRYRGIKLAENNLYPPENGWKPDEVYIVTYPKDHKRKAEEEICTASAGKPKKLEKKCVDLLVQSIPYHINNESLKAYFQKFGDVVFCDIKRDANGSSRGFGFIRFSDYEVQEKVLVLRHIIEGRWCDVKIPNSQLMDQVMRDGGDLSRGIRSSGGGYDRRIFIGRLNQEIPEDTLRSFFSKHGEVLDVFVPHPFRRWAFVTFKDPEIARSLVGRNMIIEDQSVHISYATPPKSKQLQSNANSDVIDSELCEGVISRPKRGYSSSPMTFSYSNDNSWDGYPESYGYPESPVYSKYPPPPLTSDRGPPTRRPVQPQAPIQHSSNQYNRRPQPPPLLSASASQPQSSYNNPTSQNPLLNPALLAQALTAVMSQWTQSSEGPDVGCPASSSQMGSNHHSHPHQHHHHNMPPHHSSKSSTSSSSSAYQFPPPGSYFGGHTGGRSAFGGGSTPNNNNHPF